MQRKQSREEQPLSLIQNEGRHLKDVSRDALFEYAQEVKNLGSTVFQLLSEVLGLKRSYLTGIECNQGQIILLQHEIGGLQILGAFIVNIGDLVQLISNGGEERCADVLNHVFTCFFSAYFHPASRRMYGPIKELQSDENVVIDYIKHQYFIGLLTHENCGFDLRY